MKHETEATLAIVSTRPEQVIRAIGELRELGGHALAPEEERTQVDRYYDTPGSELQRARCALRVREQGGRQLIAFKGAGETTGAAVRRVEIEGELSDEETRERIAERLRELGLELSHPSPESDPRWREIQSRETLRRPLRVGRVGEPLAELVVDTVSYNVGARVFRHHEVEIEALSDEGLAALDGLVRELEARFAPALRRWTLSKLDLGRQLEKLIARRGVAGLASLADDLLPATYELLAKGD